MRHRIGQWYVLHLTRLLNSGPLLFQLVELKNGETFNGHLVNCDNFMNITLREVYQTNSDGDRFWKLKECYIRGSTVSTTTPCRWSEHRTRVFRSNIYEYRIIFWTPSRMSKTEPEKWVGARVVGM